MKRLAILLTAALFSAAAYSTDHTITIVGNTYVPDELNVLVGDNVIIQATVTHPTTQVSESTWNADGTTPLPGGFGTNTSQFTVPITDPGTIYFVCNSHVLQGMKGKINAAMVSGTETHVNRIGFELLGNPVRDFLHYRSDVLPAGARITFFNPAGAELDSRSMDGSGAIQLNLPTGQYLFVIRNRDAEMLATGQLVVVDR